MNSGEIVSFSPLAVETEYHHWRAELAKANNPKFIPITYIDQRLADGTAYYLANAEAAIVVEIVDYPGGARAVSVMAAAGDKDTILGLLGEEAMALGWSVGADHAMVPGRQGWKRLRPDFFHYQTILVKEL
jgi:hypothetical protein